MKYLALGLFSLVVAGAAPAAALPSKGASSIGTVSQVPTVAEWDAAKEVTVKGSTDAGCETKKVREWVRVSCRKNNKAGGKPKAVTVSKGKDANVYTYATDGVVTSLVFPFVNGTDLEAKFTWSDGSKTFKSQWPKGAPEPPSKGEFS